jgi:hypothetical protein
MGENNGTFQKRKPPGPGCGGGKRSRPDAGAPVPTPRSSRARRFRRTRPLSCTPYRAGAADTATPAVLPAANAMETADFDQSMQSALPGVPPHHHDPPPTDSASLAYSQRTRAHVRATARSGRPLVRPALPLRCPIRPPRPHSCLPRMFHRHILTPLADAGQRSSTAGFRGS